MRSEREIEDLLYDARAVEETKYPGMSYEEGIKDALKWALGQTDENPLD